MRLTAEKGKICAVKLVSATDSVLIISSGGRVVKINVSDISLSGRATMGTRLVKLKQGESVVSVERIMATEDL